MYEFSLLQAICTNIVATDTFECVAILKKIRSEQKHDTVLDWP